MSSYKENNMMNLRARTRVHKWTVSARFILPSLMVAFFFTACATAPDPVPDRYLTQKSETQTSALDDIEGKIIEARQAMDEARNVKDLSDGTLQVARARKEWHEAEKKMLDLRKRVVDLWRSAEERTKQDQMVTANNAALTRDTQWIQYYETRLNQTTLDLQYKDALLQAYVSEREWLRAKIAAENLANKVVEPDPKEQSFLHRGPLVDISEYERYKNSRKELVQKLKVRLDEAAKKVNETKSRVKSPDDI